MIGSKVISGLTLAASVFAFSVSAFAADVPAPGVSPRVDAIKKAGVLRVGVLANTPWLVENTTGSGDAWQGPAWLLAQEYATQLGVTLQPIPVSHETKVPVLASNQVDLSITPLAETPERLKVVDFVLYSKTAVCVFGRKDNKKFAEATSVDAVNNADFTVAYFIGGAEENWVKERFPNAKLRGVTSSSAPAPIEEIMAKRADVAAINRVQWVLLNKKVPGLTALPQENNCQDSNEKAAPVGLAVDKGQDVFVEWLRAVEKDMQPKLTADEVRIVDTMK
ncbi:polar amino acid transport system substrate-binding protein [Neorhizobium huautlense]|uniref:Polar amino acid transport system substrate-binding protein n=1 Tax=Neorhizobium huautlense TaxID=67774 RepID=A0ABT9Q110_9HYPH|nr:transporter substrate-binding domain-containing protein [Neorhizobium huautlense]MDP9839809.1 polar amino acid transport system substrate-binding protein [Neorhizobium huautlense]